MNEVWKPVIGFESRYEVSNLGRVRSLLTGKILKQCLTRGYLYVCLTSIESQKVQKVHSLVAAAHLGSRPSGLQIAHNDGDKTNNKASNLRYTTCKDNSADRWKHGTMPNGEKFHWAKLTSEQVREIRKLIGIKSHDEIAKLFNVSATAISYIRTGKRWAWLA